jgi:arylsulfatase A-like enzyme
MRIKNYFEAEKHILLIFGIVLSSCQIGKKENTKPNIIFILTDDQGYGDMGVADHPYMKTPNIDRLSKGGTRFSQFYANATVSSPSRVALMTGQFPARNNAHHIYLDEQYGKKHGVPPFLDPSVLTIADIMKEAGYITAHIGKWHMEGSDISSPPDRYGFDYWLVAELASQSPVYRERFKSKDNFPTAPFMTKSTHWIIEDGIDFIEKHKNKDKPFYLNLWTLIPHAPLDPTNEELADYDKLKTKPEDFNSWMRGYVDSAGDMNNQMKIYCASMTSLDCAIGKLLDYLDQNGLAENTIILFTSDQGPEDYHVGDAANAGMGSTGIFRGRKRSIYEGGIRVPCIVRWPGHVPAGKVSNAVWSGVDWLPTLAKLAGVELPDSYKTDGEDVSDIFYGSDREHHKPLFWEWKFEVPGNKNYLPPQLAIRRRNWKFLCNPDGGQSELYNLTEDPSELNNQINQYPEIVKELKSILLDWKKTIPESAYSDN